MDNFLITNEMNELTSWNLAITIFDWETTARHENVDQT